MLLDISSSPFFVLLVLDESYLKLYLNTVGFSTILRLFSYSLLTTVFIIEFLWVETGRQKREEKKLNIRRWQVVKQWVSRCVMAQHACARLSLTQRIMTWCWTIDNRTRKRRVKKSVRRENLRDFCCMRVLFKKKKKPGEKGNEEEKRRTRKKEDAPNDYTKRQTEENQRWW